MESTIRNIRSAGALAVVGIALTACGGSKVQGDESVAVAAVPGGVIAVESFTSAATVTAINSKDRKLTLQFADGKKTTFKATPGMVNFSQIQVGDQVNAEVTEQAVIWLSKNEGPPSSAVGGGAVLSPAGTRQPAGVAVATVAITATITAIDQAKGKVTLQFDSGKPQTYKLGKGANLSGVAIGDQVNAVVTEGVALSVTKAP